MSLIDLEPVPISSPKKVIPLELEIVGKRTLATPNNLNAKNFFDVIEARNSTRDNSPLSESELSTFLWFSSRTKETGIGRAGLLYHHRAAPSAGGLHPIEIFYIDRKTRMVELYNPLRHSLLKVSLKKPECLERYIDEIAKITPHGAGALFSFIGNKTVTEAAYDNPESLFWRDAGCLLSVYGLCAEALNLVSCPIGILGYSFAESLGLDKQVFLPCGGIIIGSE